jgi:(1->4)-alpha-D-glucan 1-alpha-D-glucosylmutase
VSAVRDVLPVATYRVQLGPGRTLHDAAALVPHLAALGVSHLYASPFLQATPGSTHGYDVVAHDRVSDELGGDAGFAALTAALREHGLGLLVDIVPNHMAIGEGNALWWDVLENGPASIYAAWFDVDWDPSESSLRDHVLVPVLGDRYGVVLDKGELALERRGGRFVIRYHEHAWPVAPRSLDELLGEAAMLAGSDELAFLADAHGALPHATARDRVSVAVRHRDKQVLAALLERLLEADADVAGAVADVVEEVSTDRVRLHELLERQNYRLAHWRTASEQLDYRRFFDITGLAGLRVEDPEVFDAVHALPLRWLHDGDAQGLRVDHVDGLRDPAGYLERLAVQVPGAWVVVEKVLEPGEVLPPTWPVAGTTGYEFLADVDGLFVDPHGEAQLVALWSELTGEPADPEALVATCKRMVLGGPLRAELNRVVTALQRACRDRPADRDHTRGAIDDVLREVAVAFPVYRAYLRPGEEPSAADRAHLDAAIAGAAAALPDADPALLALVRQVLLTGGTPGSAELEVGVRFQQLTGPVMAKGVEDTATYRFTALTSRCEVGVPPGAPPTTTAAFHAAAAARHERWPRQLLATSTHDTKRSADVRARLHLLSEQPDRWAAAVQRWRELVDRHRTLPGAPDPALELLLFQALVGAHPLPLDRARAYALKAMREAKLHTSWEHPDTAFEEAVDQTLVELFADAAFAEEVAAFAHPLVEPGRINALATLLLQLTSPGVPDVYQGNEDWDLSLVDPDNRRPPADGRIRRLVHDAATVDAAAAWAERDSGLVKAWLLRRTLAVRRAHADAFGPGPAGSYLPLAARGERSEHAVAFLRGARIATIVPRLVLGLGGPHERWDWAGTTLAIPTGPWRDALTGTVHHGGDVPLGVLLADLPVALLVGVEP